MPPSSSSSVRNFLLQKEFPENALQKAQNSLKALEQEQHCPDGNVGRTSDGCCPCPHWRKYLPHRLDLSFCEVIKSKSEKEEDGTHHTKDTPRTAWVPQQPIHALHFQSLLDDPLDSFYGDEAPVLFGDEQERLLALKTEGLVESWHPWIEPSDPSPVAFIGNDSTPQIHAPASASASRSSTAITKAENNAKIDTSSTVVAPSESRAGAAESETSAPVAAASSEPPSNGNPSPQSETASTTSPTDENIAKATSGANPPCDMEAPDPTNVSAPPPTVPTMVSDSNCSVVAVNSTEPSCSTVEVTDIARKPVSSAATAPAPEETTQPSSKHEQEQSSSMYLLPEATFSSWHTAEEQIRLIRHAFLSKRQVILPVKRKSKSGSKGSEITLTSKVDKKRKPDSSHAGGGGSSLQAMLSDWKLPQHQPLLSIDSITDKSRNVNVAEALKPPLKNGITLDSYEAQQHLAARTVELWMEHFRSSRITYWREQKHQQQPHQKTRHSLSTAPPQLSIPLFQSELTSSSVFGTISRNSPTNNSLLVNCAAAVSRRCCQECRQLRSGVSQRRRDGNEWLIGANRIDEELEDVYLHAQDDDMLFQCLECSFIGCAPASVSSGKQTRQHMTLHFLHSNHNFGA